MLIVIECWYIGRLAHVSVGTAFKVSTRLVSNYLASSTLCIFTDGLWRHLLRGRACSSCWKRNISSRDAVRIIPTLCGQAASWLEQHHQLLDTSWSSQTLQPPYLLFPRRAAPSRPQVESINQVLPGVSVGDTSHLQALSLAAYVSIGNDTVA